MIGLSEETGRGGAPNQYQYPGEAEWRRRLWPEGGDGEVGGYGEITHGGREQDGATRSSVAADAEEAAERRRGGQEREQSERHRKVRTGQVDLGRDEGHKASHRGDGDDAGRSLDSVPVRDDAP